MVPFLLTAALTIAPTSGVADHAQADARARRPASQNLQAKAPDPVAEAYYLFLLGRRLGDEGDVEGALKAFKQAAELDAGSADIPAEIAELYGRDGRGREAIAWSEIALKKDPEHSDAHRVLGMIYAEYASRDDGAAVIGSAAGKFRAQAVDHLERAVKGASGDTAAAMRLLLGRLYLQTSSFDQAIVTLRELLADHPWLPPGVELLSQAYTGARRDADAIALLRGAAAMDPAFYESLGEAYERSNRFAEAVDAYALALEQNPADPGLKTRLAFCLLGVETSASVRRARDLLLEVTKAAPTQGWPLYLLSRASRALGDFDAAELTARRLLTLSPESTSGAHALAQVLEARREWTAVVAALEPVAASMPRGREADTALILTHLGVAYMELGRFADAVSTFERAVALDPQDGDLRTHLARAFVGARQFDKALKLVRAERVADPRNVHLARLEADSLRGLGRFDEGITLLKGLPRTVPHDPAPSLVLAEYYASDRRYAEAAALLKGALASDPDNLGVLFLFGAMLERQKQFDEAEQVFRQVIAIDPLHAPSLNYLGYTMVERGSRLSEAIAFIKKAVEIDPYNGSYLDSLGWVDVKLDQLDQAEPPLRRAAEQLLRDSVVQDHWGDFLAKKGRQAEAVEAWRRSLAGDGDGIDRAGIERKIRGAVLKSGKE